MKFIVIHYTGNAKDTAKANATYFHNGSLGASAHLFTDDESCYQSVAVNKAAWAVGGTKVYKHAECRNINSISIEMCCSGNSIVSEKTINNTAYLCAELCKYIGITADTVCLLYTSEHLLVITLPVQQSNLTMHRYMFRLMRKVLQAE